MGSLMLYGPSWLDVWMWKWWEVLPEAEDVLKFLGRRAKRRNSRVGVVWKYFLVMGEGGVENEV